MRSRGELLLEPTRTLTVSGDNGFPSRTMADARAVKKVIRDREHDQLDACINRSPTLATLLLSPTATGSNLPHTDTGRKPPAVTLSKLDQDAFSRWLTLSKADSSSSSSSSSYTVIVLRAINSVNSLVELLASNGYGDLNRRDQICQKLVDCVKTHLKDVSAAHEFLNMREVLTDLIISLLDDELSLLKFKRDMPGETGKVYSKLVALLASVPPH